VGVACIPVEPVTGDYVLELMVQLLIILSILVVQQTLLLTFLQGLPS